jgi:hypothetical protein
LSRGLALINRSGSEEQRGEIMPSNGLRSLGPFRSPTPRAHSGPRWAPPPHATDPQDRVRSVAGHSGSVRSFGSSVGRSLWGRSLFSLGFVWLLTAVGFVRVAHRSDWSGVDGKDACDRDPETTQPWGGAWLAQAPGSLVELLERPSEEEPSYLHCHRNFCQMV